MNKKSLLLIAELTLVLLLLIGCVEDDSEEPAPTATAIDVTYPLKGVSISPKSFEGSDFTGFFEKAIEGCEVITWAGDWDELSYAEGGGPRVLTGLSSIYNYTPLVIAHFFIQSTGQLIRPLDAATKQSYKESAVAFVEEYRPEYLALGIEINTLYEKSPEDFNEFVEFYNEVWDAIKTASPGTRVFTIFQLERMKGLHGGLFGGVDDPNSLSEWSLLDKFPKSDFIAFTTYPCLIYKDPADIPDDYYNEIGLHTTKPVVFTEIGWFRDGPTGWESDENEQAEFIDTFFKLTEQINPEIAIWSFLYDQGCEGIETPFETMGLLRADQTTSAAYEAWIND